MNDRLGKAEVVFHEALEVPPEQCEGFLQQTCGDDAELRREVAGPLRASGVADEWLKDADIARQLREVESELAALKTSAK